MDSRIDIMARTIYGEARGEGFHGMLSVAFVIRNRLFEALSGKKPYFGNTVSKVCLTPYQFSCWQKTDVNFKVISDERLSEFNNPEFATAVSISRFVLDFEVADITHGATHYHSKFVKPYWASELKPCFVSGNHLFYNNVR